MLQITWIPPLLLTHILFIYFLVKNKALKKNKVPFLGLNPSCIWIRKNKGSVACHWGESRLLLPFGTIFSAKEMDPQSGKGSQNFGRRSAS